MGSKKPCEIFFQRGIENLRKEEDMAPETIESLSIKFVLILERLEEIKEVLGNLPCQDHESRIAKLEIQFQMLDNQATKNEDDKNKEIYPRLRELETSMATVTEQNKGQDAWSGKIWALILMGINAVYIVVIYFITRGVTP